MAWGKKDAGKGGLFADGSQTLAESDPEFMDLFSAFAYREVVDEPAANHPDLTDARRSMAILAALMGCQGADAFAMMATVALDSGMTPIQLKEVVYQGCAYLGFGRALLFLRAANEALHERGVATPLEPQGTVTPENRGEAGERAQCACFGEHMRGFAEAGPEETRHIRGWLVRNCFGDYYTRGGLSLREREMITACYLAAQGGCEPQLVSRLQANRRVGNDRAFMVAVFSQILPYIGYPRTLNALACLDKAEG